MDINPADIYVTTFNTGSSWFPKCNGVAIMHVPTGIEVRHSEERSPWANKAKAFEKLVEILNEESDYTKQMELEF